MATIYHSSSKLTDGGDYDEMQLFVNNYWGSADREKIFPIPFWQAIQMLAASTSEQIAFHITDYDNPLFISAEWEVYNNEIESLLEAKTLPEEYYVVLNEAGFQNIRDSIPNLGNPVNRLMLWGRIGKTDTGQFVAFIVAAKGSIFNQDNSGGDGASSGIKIPPGGSQ